MKYKNKSKKFKKLSADISENINQVMKNANNNSLEDFDTNVVLNEVPVDTNNYYFAYNMDELFESAYSDVVIEDNVFLNEPQTSLYEDENIIKRAFEDIFKENITKEEKENAKKIIVSDKKAKAINTYSKIILETTNLMVLDNKLFIYIKPLWKEITEKQFITKIKNFPNFRLDFEHFSMKNFSELYTAVITSPKIQAEKEDFKSSENLISFYDGVYNVYNDKIYRPSPEFKFFSYINANVNNLDDTYCYYFEEFVENASNGNKNWRTLLLEILGCIISGFNPKAFFVFYGPKNTGKSEFANFCKLIVGEEFCVGIKGPNAFSEKWTTGSLFGKKLCLASDISNSIINSEAVATIKSITGNDWISGEYKYKQPFSFKNEASILFCSNHKLQISSFDEAFFDRLIYLPFQNSVPKEKRIPNLSEKLFEERGYIVNEAIKALQQLIRRNFSFTYVDVADENTLIYSENNSVNEFIAKKCTESENNFIAFSYIYDTYCMFCNENNFVALNKIEFGRKFKSAVSETLPSVEFKATAKAKGYKNLVLLAENNIF